jgi:plastocyanin
MVRNALLVASLMVLGCGGGTPAPASPTPAANAAVVNGCNGGDYSDHTADADAQGTHVKWDESIASSNDRCIKVRVGSTVTFEGDFAKHPMSASGGESVNPLAGIGERIANPASPEEFAPTKFEKTGVYGFVCSKHPEMKGAILVVP